MSDEDTERRLNNEIEIARHALEGDIEKETRDAEEKLDRILSKNDMEFCSRCGRKVEGRMDWAGKCLNRNCKNLICRDCWIAKKRRFCMDHYKQMVATKPEEEGREKTFFREEVEKPKGEASSQGGGSQRGQGPLVPDLGTLKESREEAELRERVERLTNNYRSFLEARFRAQGTIDFTPEGFFEKPRSETVAGGDEVWVRVFTKGFLRSRKRLNIIVKSIYSENANYLVTKIQERVGGVFSIIVLVGDRSPSSTISYVNKFDNKGVSLFLVEPAQSLIYYNDGVPINRLYSVWFNAAKNPLGFMDVLKSIAERVSNRWVVSIKRVSDEFGYPEDKASEVLKGCGFLSPVPDTDQFLFKEVGNS